MATASNDPGPRGFALKQLHLIGVAIIVMAIAMGYSGLRTAFDPTGRASARQSRAGAASSSPGS